MNRTWMSRLFDDESSIWSWFAAAILISIPAYWRATDVIFSVLALVIFIRSIRDRSFQSVWESIRVFGIANWLILGWFTSTVIGYGLTAGYGEEQVEEILGLRWLLSLYLSAYLGARIRFSERGMRWLFLLLSTVMLFTLYYQYSSNLLQLVTFGGVDRYEGTFGNASVAACALGVLWGAYVGWGNFSGIAIRSYNLFLLLLVLLTTYFIFLTQSRGTWVTLVVVFIVYSVMVPSRKNLYAGFVFTVFCGILYAFDLFRFQSRIKYSLDWSSGNSQGLRIGLWRSHWEIFLDHFWFGTGFREPLRLLPEYYARLGVDNRIQDGQIYYSHAHSHLLQILSGAGIFGFTFFTLTFVVTMAYLWRQWKRSEKGSVRRTGALACLLALTAFLANGVVDTPFLIHSARLLILLFLGLFVGFINKFKLRED